MIKIKRVYDEPSPHDGKRILVDRFWPRGLRKEEARIDAWFRELSPSNELRIWFNHDPDKWGGFKKRFFTELRGKEDLIGQIANYSMQGTVTLLFGSKEERINNAVALKEYLEVRMNASRGRKAA